MRARLTVFGFRLDVRSRLRRRVLVIVVYLALAAMLSASLRWAPWTLGNVGFFLVIALVNWMVFGGLTTRGLVPPFSPDIRPLWVKDDQPPESRIDRWFWRRSPARKDLQTDERDDRRRDRAHYLAYRFVTWLTMVVWFLFVTVHAGPVFGTKGLPFDFALLVALAVAMLAQTLPQAILLWTEPDMEEA